MPKIIEGTTIHDCWIKLNQDFIHGSPEGAMVMAGRDFSLARYHVTMHAPNGFGKPLERTLPLFNGQKRLDTLAKRYIDPDLWDEGIARLVAREKRSTGSYPNSFIIQFHRRDTSERKVPAGGGCLVGLNFTWYQKKWHLHLLSRASEITSRLLADICFAEQAVARAVEEGHIRKWDVENIDITWTLLLPSQMKYMVPLFLMLTESDQAAINYMTSKPENPWQNIVQEHFWETVIYPERISWAQRRKWSEKFLSWSGIDWAAYHQMLIDENELQYTKKVKKERKQ